MILLHKINIAILDFIKTGRFDYLKLGQTKEWILNNFPDPEFIGDSVMDAPIWFYGSIELHFDKDELFLIFSEDMAALDGGQFLELDKWIFGDPTKLTLANFIAQLNLEDIDFSKRTEKFDSKYIRITITQSNVQLSFVDAENELDNPNEFPLTSISLIR